jgi:hypothetical protein
MYFLFGNGFSNRDKIGFIPAEFAVSLYILKIFSVRTAFLSEGEVSQDYAGQKTSQQPDVNEALPIGRGKPSNLMGVLQEFRYNPRNKDSSSYIAQ